MRKLPRPVSGLVMSNGNRDSMWLEGMPAV
jgi:hypothetical protein